jgi:hypothetical protein
MSSFNVKPGLKPGAALDPGQQHLSVLPHFLTDLQTISYGWLRNLTAKIHNLIR